VIGGFAFANVNGAEAGQCILTHSERVESTYSSIKSRGRAGYQWWVLEAWPDSAEPPKNIHQRALDLSEQFQPVLRRLIKATEEKNCQRWAIRDVIPMKQWSNGRVTLAGDAAHAASPYAAYGAGMSICDGYFIGQCLHNIDLGDTAKLSVALKEYESIRIPHTIDQVNAAHFLGRLFHHMPYPLTCLRDFVLDRIPLLPKEAGDRNPIEISEQLVEMGGGILEKRRPKEEVAQGWFGW
jgi:2-polyprenyl-6-methoxyphenol hydroxylase-like FAD-dependent oxidoreductase